MNFMKKIFALLLIMLVCLIPVALADKPANVGMKNETKTMIAEKKATMEELKNNTEACKGNKNETCKQIRRDFVDKIHTSTHQKIGPILIRTEKLELKLDRILSKLNVTDVNTTALHLKLDEARTAYNESVVLFNKAHEAGMEKQRDEFMKLSTQKLRESLKAIKEAHEILKEIVKSLRSPKKQD